MTNAFRIADLPTGATDVGVAAEKSYGVAASAGRLPDETRLGAVQLAVSDLARSVEYYRDVLGLRETGRADGVVTLGAHGDDAPLVVLHEQRGVRRARGRLGLYHFAILLPDRAALGCFVTHLGRIGARAGASDHFVSEALYLQDPDGLGIEVYADRPRDAWRRRGRELERTTVPLDVESVGAAGRGEPWTGMPAGTVIGHVHLHVGDLDEGAAFYHSALGLDVVVWSYPGALFLSAGGYHHHLGTNPGAGLDAKPAQEDEARLLEWTIVLPRAADAEAVAQRIERAGYAITRSGGREAGGQAHGWVASDPWGTHVRLTGAER